MGCPWTSCRRSGRHDRPQFFSQVGASHSDGRGRRLGLLLWTVPRAIVLVFPGMYPSLYSMQWLPSVFLFLDHVHAIYSFDTNKVLMIGRCDHTRQAVIGCHQIGPYRSTVRQAAAAFFVGFDRFLNSAMKPFQTSREPPVSTPTPSSVMSSSKPNLALLIPLKIALERLLLPPDPHQRPP